MKKQITIDGENSDWYEKAIFILKDKEPHYVPDNLFLYAEQIVENHLKKNPQGLTYHSKGKTKRVKKEGSSAARFIDYFFNFSLFVCAVSIVIVLVLMFA